MPEFDDYDNLFNYIDEKVEKALPNLGDLFRAQLDQYVMEFYRMYTPSLYVRTYDLINSITVSPVYKNGDLTSVDVYFDENLIHPKISTFFVPKGLQRFNHHIDLQGNPVSDIMPFIANDGWKMPRGGKRPGGKFLLKIDRFALNNSNWLDYFKGLLRNQGLDVE
jgi:hypothetical protein